MTTVTTTPPPITLAAARESVRAATALHEAAHVVARAVLGLESIGVAIYHDDIATITATTDALAEVVVPRVIVDRRDIAVEAMAGQAVEAMLEAGVDDPHPNLDVAVDLAARIDLLPRTPATTSPSPGGSPCPWRLLRSHTSPLTGTP